MASCCSAFSLRLRTLVEFLEALLRGPELALELLVVERRVPAARVEPVVLDVEDLGAVFGSTGARRGCGVERGVVVGVGERARVGFRGPGPYRTPARPSSAASSRAPVASRSKGPQQLVGTPRPSKTTSVFR